MEKTITVRRTSITFSLWDLGGQREFVNMLPLVCNDAVAILFMFDLSRKSTLNSVKEWYRQARGFNKVQFFSPFFLCSFFTTPHPSSLALRMRRRVVCLIVSLSSADYQFYIALACTDCNSISDRHQV